MILVCGEAIIDLLTRTDSEGHLASHAVAGGSPFNVAIGIARLGSAAGFLGGLSTDKLGDFLAGALRRNQVDLSHVRRTARPTTLSIATADAQGEIQYTFYGHLGAEGDVRTADLPALLSPAVECMVAGSYSLALEPFGGAIETLVARESGRITVSLDPNIRLSLIPDLAEWHRRFDRLVRRADIVKASEEDIQSAYGTGATIPAIAERWLAAAITCSRAGADLPGAAELEAFL